MVDQSAQTLTPDQAATLLDRSKRWVHNLREAGFVTPVSKGRYPVVGLVRGALAYYDDQLSKANKSAAASRSSDARTREIELRISEREGRLLPVEDCEAVVAELAALVLSQFSGLGARVTRDLQLRRQIDAEVDRVLDAIKRHAEEQGEALQSGRVDLDQE